MASSVRLLREAFEMRDSRRLWLLLWRGDVGASMVTCFCLRSSTSVSTRGVDAKAGKNTRPLPP